ncbi:hypothetical protein [Roseomonas harenae]|uniref:hypothetical protein n=1 Tax=Muricoccus harenae TaxID=2692566 RepID=UPI0013319A79|nr:hypothetical protein [Roseomonas harenae]
MLSRARRPAFGPASATPGAGLLTDQALAQPKTPPQDPSLRTIPSTLLPVPGTVSPELQRRIGAPYPDGWDTNPGTPAA